MQAYKFDTTLPASRHLEITLPETFPVGEQMEVICLVKSGEPSVNEVPSEDPVTDIEALLTWLKQQPPGPHTEEEIEAWIREERDAWGDD
jgi:hypothetical protein